MLGFRERLDGRPGFILAPSLPDPLMQPGKRYVLHNMKVCGHTFDLAYRIGDGHQLEAELKFTAGAAPGSVRVTDTQDNKVLFEAKRPASASFTARNLSAFDVTFET
jgi:hypothetical protein